MFGLRFGLRAFLVDLCLRHSLCAKTRGPTAKQLPQHDFYLKIGKFLCLAWLCSCSAARIFPVEVESVLVEFAAMQNVFAFTVEYTKFHSSGV